MIILVPSWLASVKPVFNTYAVRYEIMLLHTTVLTFIFYNEIQHPHVKKAGTEVYILYKLNLQIL